MIRRCGIVQVILHSDMLGILSAMRKQRRAVLAQTHEKTRRSLALIDRSLASLARCDSRLALGRLRVQRSAGRRSN